MSAILVTGGMGVIGSWVTRQLIDQGVKVVTYDSHLDTALTKDIIDQFDCVVGDVLDLPKLIQTIKHYGVERVIHMAGLSTPPLEANPFMGYRVNVDGAVNVFEASRLTDVKRVVAISSKSVYDRPSSEYGHPTYKPVDEEYPKAPTMIYGATKFFIENMGLAYNRIYGLDVICLRFGGTYGPAKQTRRAVGGISGPGAHDAFSKIIEAGMLGQSLNIPSGGDQLDDIVYHKDVANGVVLACFAENLEHRVFQIGTGKGVTLRQLAEIVNKLFPKAKIEVGPGLSTSTTQNPCILNIERAHREFGYSPQYDLEKGVRDYIAEMRRLDIGPVLLS
jgi:UDP-glucose 4-epimerase